MWILYLEKSKYLLKEWKVEGDGEEGGVKLFRADLLEQGSFEDAVKGCCGIFHVAAPMKFQVSVQEDADMGKIDFLLHFLHYVPSLDL